jgi:O6-methylguanine-DNA--protein-cysteine methyltransferase
VSRRVLLVVAFVFVFIGGAGVGFAVRPTFAPTAAEQTQAELHARVQECVAQFQQTHLWPNSCPPVFPPETEAQRAMESLCPHGYGTTTVSGETTARCNDPSPRPSAP